MTQPTPDRERESLLKWLDDQRSRGGHGGTWPGPEDTRIPRG
jgi:hypothetical protein